MWSGIYNSINPVLPLRPFVQVVDNPVKYTPSGKWLLAILNSAAL